MMEPDFENLLKVLRRQVPARPTLFEFFLNKPLYEKLTAPELTPENKDWQMWHLHPVEICAFRNAGYDYVTLLASDMEFPAGEIPMKQTISLNAGSAIRNRRDFQDYPWPNPDGFDYSRLERAAKMLPDGMKLVVQGPCGVLENVIALVGYESLCMMLTDEPDLASDIFDAVGQRLVRYYEISAAYDTVGALISNDDWGFKTQTMLSPDDMRRFVFGWHKKIVEVIHAAGKPAILHSCGNLEKVMDDIIDDMKYDAKHSFEDVIMPVEQVYERWADRIAILGGIDLGFVCSSTPQQIKQRCRAMLAKAQTKGGYALGTGNSVPEYVPDENYLAMITTVTDSRSNTKPKH
ncbi:MAG: uroporphyrinogen decarboxylase family protein [Planctomycetota bacterium]|jgi:uroporphyrinogen decarboxylase